VIGTSPSIRASCGAVLRSHSPSGLHITPSGLVTGHAAAFTFHANRYRANDVCKTREPTAYHAVREGAMTKLDVRRRQMLERVRDFGAAHRDIFPPASFAGRMFAAVAEASDAVKRHEMTEMSGHHGERQGAASKATARMALRRRLGLISRIARVAAYDIPGFDKRFRVRFDCSDERLLSRARSFVKAAQPLMRTFVAHDMPPTLLAKLQEDIEAFDRAITLREDSRGQRVAARASLDAEVRKGLQAARRLAAVVPHKLEDPASLALWNAARRIGYPPRIKSPAAA
jgi:hypothetical protein